MSHSTRTPCVDKQDWAQAADKAKEAAAYWGEMASRAASEVGAMASQAASNVGKKADDLATSITPLIRRNAIPAVLIGIGLGWFAWCKLKR